MACRFATWPTSRSPLLEMATTEGVIRPPSAFGMTAGSPASITATQEFVVPRSIPITLPISSPQTCQNLESPQLVLASRQDEFADSPLRNEGDVGDAPHPARGSFDRLRMPGC